MDIEKKNKLDAKLREMMEKSEQRNIGERIIKKQTGVGSIIRRRKGEQDKRISV